MASYYFFPVKQCYHMTQYMQSCPVNQFVDVRMEDLLYFKNLTSIDLSDNKISLEWLRNLENIEEIDLQYNSLTSIKDI